MERLVGPSCQTIPSAAGEAILQPTASLHEHTEDILTPVQSTISSGAEPGLAD